MVLVSRLGWSQALRPQIWSISLNFWYQQPKVSVSVSTLRLSLPGLSLSLNVKKMVCEKNGLAHPWLVHDPRPNAGRKKQKKRRKPASVKKYLFYTFLLLQLGSKYEFHKKSASWVDEKHYTLDAIANVVGTRKLPLPVFLVCYYGLPFLNLYQLRPHSCLKIYIKYNCRKENNVRAY